MILSTLSFFDALSIFMENSPAKICFLLILLSSLACTCVAVQVSHDGRAITINGQRRILVSGSIHYPRSTPDMWPDLIDKAKQGGLDAIDTYVFWNANQPLENSYDFTGNLNLIRFIKTIQAAGLYAVLRIGPYVSAGWNYGGLPVWLDSYGKCQVRTNNIVYMSYMQNFTTYIVNMVKQENLFASQGGPIILAQIENEYGNVISSYGDAGKAYLNWCVDFAESLDIGVPWIMCQQSDAPQPIIDTCNGFYCDQFTPNNPNSPKMWTENWTGWFKDWGGKDPHRTAEDLAFAVARFFQSGGTFMNYYMYHGGTNFGRSAGGPYITTSYDFDAPLNEYGGFNQPKYGHLQELHGVLHSIERILTYGNVTNNYLGNSVQMTIYTLNGTSSCFFGNVNQTIDATVTYNRIRYTVPAWSVSILPDCKTVVYNTAKVNTQTTLMVKNFNHQQDEPAAFNWTWKPEPILGPQEVGNYHFFQYGGGIPEQSQLSWSYYSDYNWYMTTVNFTEDDPFLKSEIMTLRVTGAGYIMHAYVNGEYLGSKWARIDVERYVFEMNVKLNAGTNNISIHSVTIGLPNNGAFFDDRRAGLTRPIELIGTNITIDLANYRWYVYGGLHSVIEGALILHALRLDSSATRIPWQTDDLPTYRRMTWYRTTFQTPSGKDPVVLDLQGLGKGIIWVNGIHLGRYWPGYIAENGCSTDPCDYRGPYTSSKCATNCGQPTQRWHHVPRFYLTDGNFLRENETNELVLFEELGGDIGRVNFQTVAVGTACGNAYEGKSMGLSCENRMISDIKFASFGDVTGTCGSFKKVTCQASWDVVSIVKKQCVGNLACSIQASESVFGSTNCAEGVEKRLVVVAIC